MIETLLIRELSYRKAILLWQIAGFLALIATAGHVVAYVFNRELWVLALGAIPIAAGVFAVWRQWWWTRRWFALCDQLRQLVAPKEG